MQIIVEHGPRHVENAACAADLEEAREFQQECQIGYEEKLEYKMGAAAAGKDTPPEEDCAAPSLRKALAKEAKATAKAVKANAKAKVTAKDSDKDNGGTAV